ncbi:MAG: hypothetical protein ACFFAU_05630 [Candidatus Hodarchaeota archaeon]
MISKYFRHLSEFYKVNFLRRLIIGVLSGGMVGILFFAITYILELFLWDNAFNRTFLHDLPSIGVIIALIVSFEIFGFFPHPTTVNGEKGKIKTQTFENQSNNQTVTLESSEKTDIIK